MRKKETSNIVLDFLHSAHGTTPNEYIELNKQKDILIKYEALDFYFNQIKKQSQSLDFLEVYFKDIGRFVIRPNIIYKKIKSTIKTLRKLKKDISNLESLSITTLKKSEKKEYKLSNLKASLLVYYKNLEKLLILRNLIQLQIKYKISNLKVMLLNGYTIKHLDWSSHYLKLKNTKK